MFISSILFSGSIWMLLIPVFIFAGIITNIIFYLKNSRPAWKKQTNLKKGGLSYMHNNPVYYIWLWYFFWYFVYYIYDCPLLINTLNLTILSGGLIQSKLA